MSDWIDFDYAVMRFVPSVHRQTSFPVGVILHAPTKDYLQARTLTDLDGLATLAPDTDLQRLADYLESLIGVAAGKAGPLGNLNRSERFGWLTAPRSDVLQPSPRHPGRTRDLDATLLSLFEQQVGR